MWRDRLLFPHSVPGGRLPCPFGRPLMLVRLALPTLLCLNQSPQHEVGTPQLLTRPFLVVGSCVPPPGSWDPTGQQNVG